MSKPDLNCYISILERRDRLPERDVKIICDKVLNM